MRSILPAGATVQRVEDITQLTPPEKDFGPCVEKWYCYLLLPAQLQEQSKCLTNETAALPAWTSAAGRN